MLEFPRWKVAFVIVLSLLSLYVALPTLIPSLRESTSALLPHRAVSLGLDLQGGSHLLLEVDVDAYVQEQYQQLETQLRNALRKDKIGYRALQVKTGALEVALTDASQESAVRSLITGLDTRFDVTGENGTLRMVMSSASIREARLMVVEQSIEIVRRRVDETGTREPIIQRQGDSRILLQVPGLQDPEHLKRMLGKTAKLTFHLVDETVQPRSLQEPGLPAGSKILPVEGSDAQHQAYVAVDRRPMLAGDMLQKAAATYEQGMPVVSFGFNTQGAKKFAEITTANVNKRFAIVLDNKIISAPVIREPILGGSGQISGSFSVQTANDLALLLRAGALPAPLKILEERTVGPSLGEDSIQDGKRAGILALVLVAIFMLFTYRLLGLFANIGLVVNLVMLMALLSLLQATLTLPGIAGIILTIGMAVDANVLIFERIKEELRNGKTLLSALDAGFRRAFGTIMDSNITGLLSALLLYYFGAGPVKGFAVTLSAGIVTSMFTAVLFTRMLVVLWVKKTKPKTLTI